jgi:hypothetical protein
MSEGGYDWEPLNSPSSSSSLKKSTHYGCSVDDANARARAIKKEPPILERETARLLEGLGAQVAGFSWPRISPSGFLAVCTLMYILPFVTALD